MRTGDRVRVFRAMGPNLFGVYSGARGDRVLVTLDGKAKSRPFAAHFVRPCDDVPLPPNQLTAAPNYDVSDPESDIWIDKTTPVRDPAYLRWIRQQSCPWTGSGHVEASHHPEPMHGRMGAKTDDYRTIPLSPETHREFHAKGAIGNMTPEQTRQWVETQINRHLIKYLREVMDR